MGRKLKLKPSIDRSSPKPSWCDRVDPSSSSRLLPCATRLGEEKPKKLLAKINPNTLHDRSPRFLVRPGAPRGGQRRRFGRERYRERERVRVRPNRPVPRSTGQNTLGRTTSKLDKIDIALLEHTIDASVALALLDIDTKSLLIPLIT